MIHLIDDLYMDVDPLCYVIKQKIVTKNKKAKTYGEARYEAVAYLTKTDQLITWLYERKIKESKYKSLKAINDRSKRLCRELEHSIKRIDESLRNGSEGVTGGTE